MSAYGRKVDDGRVLLLLGLLAQGDLWFGIGEGDWADKTAPPPEPVAQTGLLAERARKRVTRHAWLARDDAGSLLFNGHPYAEVTGPTPVIAFFGDFLEGEGTGIQICEEGLFGGGVQTSAVPFALASQVITPGRMLWLKNREIHTKNSTDTITLVAIIGG